MPIHTLSEWASGEEIKIHCSLERGNGNMRMKLMLEYIMSLKVSRYGNETKCSIKL